jgi:eukaryotic-like serine/threonine-protein kinase
VNEGDQLPTGTVIGGKYQILDTAGLGGSGTVYRVHPLGKRRVLALKLMNAGLPDSDGERARFAREAEVVKRLQHPHIVGLVDFGHHQDGTPFLVQPFLEGETLEDKLLREGAFPWALVSRLSIHVLRALDKAHGVGIVHRDIKPPNIFVSRGVLGEVAQVLDFGLAKVVRGDNEQQLDVTKVGAVIGTPRYMAPEQARGEQVGPTADIYSFGLVMAEMLLGRPLVDGKNDIELYVAQGSDSAHRLLPQILQSPFASVVQRAVAKPLDVRYREAAQMLADVRAVDERLGGGATSPVEADMDATCMLDPSTALALSLPNETSEKLRSAFNVIAKKNERAAAQASPAQPSPAQAAAPQAPVHQHAAVLHAVPQPALAAARAPSQAPPVPRRAAPSPQHAAPPVRQAAPVQHAAPPVQHAAPPVQHAAPPVQHAAPPVQHAAPPVQHGAPGPQAPVQPAPPAGSQPPKVTERIEDPSTHEIAPTHDPHTSDLPNLRHPLESVSNEPALLPQPQPAAVAAPAMAIEPMPPTIHDPSLALGAKGGPSSGGLKVALAIVSLLLVVALAALGYLLFVSPGAR